MFVGLGSNQGDRASALAEALSRLALLPGTTVVAVSPVYETESVEAAGGLFLNAAVEISTTLSPTALLEALLTIEERMGRAPVGARQRGEPRPIDLDLLLYNDVELAGDRLTLPHPGLESRLFVLRPMADLAPNLVPPGWDKSVGAAAEELAGGPSGSEVRRLAAPLKQRANRS